MSHLAGNMQSLLKEKFKCFVTYSVAIVEIKDIKVAAQFAVYIRGVKEDF